MILHLKSGLLVAFYWTWQHLRASSSANEVTVAHLLVFALLKKLGSLAVELLQKSLTSSILLMMKFLPYDFISQSLNLVMVFLQHYTVIRRILPQMLKFHSEDRISLEAILTDPGIRQALEMPIEKKWHDCLSPAVDMTSTESSV
eukprot:m.137058 g.137058  ORF g.137058 m.137058 type:complete len:145 (+) comp38209_c0_seq2:1854-2288(+)